MKVNTKLKAGRLATNHSRSLAKARGLQVKTSVKACALWQNHNQTLSRCW